MVNYRNAYNTRTIQIDLLTYENFEIILGAVAIEGCYYAAWTGQINQIHMF